jgi:hypothetical protein
MASLHRIAFKPCYQNPQNPWIANSERAEQEPGVGVFFGLHFFVEGKQRLDRRRADIAEGANQRHRRIEMVAPEAREKEGDHFRSSKVAENLNQVLRQILARVLSVLQPEADQICDGFLGIVHQGMQKAMVDTHEALFGRAEQIIGGDLCVLLRG